MSVNKCQCNTSKRLRGGCAICNPSGHTIIADAKDSNVSGIKGCTCNFRTYMLGDGCEVCNPGLALEYAKENIEEIEQQRDALQRQNAYLAEQLNDAAESVQEWGNYADQYFQEKWNLDGDVKKYKDAANSNSSQSAEWLEASHIEWMKGLEPAGIVGIDTAYEDFPSGTPLYTIPNKND